ncbi:hypothetical protein LQ327_02755 [Actinomycetospora endophytica]|uniref:Uncharacterized protein n=1 Tax=Actinomycetospora endophytica TaxID=2291215 RepID=A0ABS8P230_9PSEU|nr:hypothetical protein [Actinomycetospora endophytica]MCD2192316.1 hypothetical protein [Actinomycetospora endophytica]
MGERRVDLDRTSWETLPARALEVLARECSARRAPGARSPRAGEPPRAEAIDALVAGVATLAAAVGAEQPDSPDVAGCLRRAVELTAGVGEAAWRVSCSAGAAGQERAAETADVVMGAALTLRILAELGQRVVPPADADPRPSR